MKSKLTRHGLALSTSIAALFIPAKGMATDYFWTGAFSSNQYENGNWLGGTPPGSPPDFAFNPWIFGSDAVNSTMIMNLNNANSGIVVNSGIGFDMTFNGPGTIKMINSIDLSTAAHDLTINAPLAWLFGGITWNVGPSRTLTVNGGLTSDPGFDVLANPLVKSGAGTAVLASAATTILDTTISGGTFQIASAGTINGGTYSGAISVATGANLKYSSSAAQTFSGVISGAGSLTKDTSSSALSLSGNNTYSGGTNINNGLVMTDATNAIGSGAVTVASGANWTLSANGQTHTIAGLSGAGNVTRLAQTTLGVATGANGESQISTAKNYVQLLDFGDAGGATVNGVAFQSVSSNSGPNWDLTGATAQFFNDNGSGYHQLTSDFFYNGNPGVLTFSNLTLGKTYQAMLYLEGAGGVWGGRPQDGTFTNGASTSTLSFEPGSVGYVAYSFTATDPTATLSMLPTAGNTFHWFGASLEDQGTQTGAASTITVGDANNYTFSGVISGNLSLVKQGSGTQTLSGANTYSGVTTLAGGVLNVASLSDYGVAGGLGNRAAVDDAPGIVGILFQGGTLQYTGSTAQSTNRGIRVSTTGGGATIDASGSNSGATLSFTAASSSDFFENGGNRTLTLTGSNTGANTFAMAIGDAIGTTSFVKSGAGKWVLTGANGYTGTTTISGGTLEIGGAGTLGNGSYAGNIIDGGAFVYSSSANQTLSGIITGSGSITKNGSGTLTLTQATADLGAPHLFDGAITINSGTLVVADVSFGLNFTSSITVNGGTLNVQTQPSEQGNLYLNGGTVTSTGLANATFGNILLSQNSTAVHAGGAAVSTISVNQLNLWGTNSIDVGAGSTLNITSEVAEYGGAGSLNKTGAGTLTLSGANTYTGATNVNGGTLLVSGSLSGSSAVTVISGGTLGTQSGTGGGTVGALTVESGGTLAPGASGASRGKIATGNLSIASGGIFAAEVNATGDAGANYDQVSVTGTVNITSSTLTLSGAYLTTPAVTNDLFFILLNDGIDPITGSFANATLGEDSNYHVFAANGQDYLISYAANFDSLSFTGGNDIALMAVPEPGAAVSLLGGLGLLLGVRRRRA